jgi:hypothetical protein
VIFISLAQQDVKDMGQSAGVAKGRAIGSRNALMQLSGLLSASRMFPDIESVRAKWYQTQLADAGVNLKRLTEMDPAMVAKLKQERSAMLKLRTLNHQKHISKAKSSNIDYEILKPTVHRRLADRWRETGTARDRLIARYYSEHGVAPVSVLKKGPISSFTDITDLQGTTEESLRMEQQREQIVTERSKKVLDHHHSPLFRLFKKQGVQKLRHLQSPAEVRKRYGKWMSILANHTLLSAILHQEGNEGLTMFGYNPSHRFLDHAPLQHDNCGNKGADESGFYCQCRVDLVC